MSDSVSVRSAGPEAYIRTNITKNTKGYSYETTVSLRWQNGTETTFSGTEFLVETPGVDGDDFTLKHPSRVLGDLHRMADAGAREEIARRQALDLDGAE